MGSETSKGFRDNSLLSNNYSSDYDGIKTTEESSIDDDYIPNDKEEIHFNIEQKTKNINALVSPNKVPVTFEWDQDGNSVYVTGDFCAWKQFFLMDKNSNGTYFVTLKLNKGLIQYKFKVDNQWKCNEKFPTMNDGHGNKNNYIDTTNWEISAEGSEINTTINTNSINELSAKHKYNKTINTQNNYSSYIPKMDDMNDFAPKIPGPYKSTINLKNFNRQSKIGSNKYLPPEEDDLIGENYSYKKIKHFRHEEINHIRYKLKNVNKKPLICSIISRYRLKFTSFVYYK